MPDYGWDECTSCGADTHPRTTYCEDCEDEILGRAAYLETLSEIDNRLETAVLEAPNEEHQRTLIEAIRAIQSVRADVQRGNDE